jgi:spermidine synthase
MKRASPRLLAIESLYKDENVMLRLLEPRGSSRKALHQQVYSGSYAKPFVIDNGPRRFLHFDLDAVQSAMDLGDPARLALPYTRKMMAFLLFNPAPKRILLLGLGGGSLAKFCYAYLPAATLTAVEVNQDVIDLREEFGVPGDDHRFRVIKGDGAAYVSTMTQREDVIVADACDRNGMAAAFDSLAFYRKARRYLAPGGVFVTNLCGDKLATAAHLSKLRDAFGDALLTLAVRKGGNVIVLGFKERPANLRWKRIEAQAAELKRRYRLDFPRYARRMAAENSR